MRHGSIRFNSVMNLFREDVDIVEGLQPDERSSWGWIEALKSHPMMTSRWLNCSNFPQISFRKCWSGSFGA